MKYLRVILLLGMVCLKAGAADYSDCFIPGEATEYKISWMGIPLAWSQTSMESVEEEGRNLVRLRMESKSYKTYSHIYKVDDRTDVFIDPETALPVRVDLRIHEGDRRISHLTTFYHKEKVAIFQNRITKDIKEVPITKETQDIYSFIFANRNTDFDVLAKEMHTLYADGKIYEMGMNILGEETIKLPNHGRVDCIKVEPKAEFDGMFVQDGKILFWVSKEKRRMVTCIQAKVPVGKIQVKLEKVSGPSNDFWTNPKE